MPPSPISQRTPKSSRGNSFLVSKPAISARTLSATNPRTEVTMSRCSAERPKSRSTAGTAYPLPEMRLYNSLTRQVEEITPVDGETVRMYSCGPTVYRYAHIGNMRSFMLGDLICRGLRFEGTPVEWVMNITDVGHMTDDASVDKMDLAASDEGLSPMEIAEKYTQAFLEDSDAVGIQRADSY